MPTRIGATSWGLVGRITKRPVVGTLHGYVETGVKSRLWARVNERLLGSGWLSAVTVPTRVLSRRLPRAHWVPNALPATRAEGALAALSPPVTPTFGVVARLSREKGVHVFLEAIQGLPTDWRFVVIGAGAEEGRLLRHTAAGRVSWTGFRPDAAERMRAFTALVVPSLSEGLPITVLEAAAQGVPIVASAVGGVPEVVEAGVTGLLVPSGDARALGKAMEHVVSDAEGTRRRAEAARKRFLEAHTLERTGAALEALYATLLERSS